MEQYTIEEEVKGKFFWKVRIYRINAPDMETLRFKYPNVIFPILPGGFYSKESVTNACNKLNKYIQAKRYRIFKNGNNRYIICEKMHRGAVFKDEQGVPYAPVPFFMDRKVQKESPWGTSYDYGPIDADKEYIEDGFEDIDSACTMLERIEKYSKEQDDKIREEIIKKERKNTGVPVPCL